MGLRGDSPAFPNQESSGMDLRTHIATEILKGVLSGSGRVNADVSNDILRAAENDATAIELRKMLADWSIKQADVLIQRLNESEERGA